MKRKIYDSLKAWKTNDSGRVALLIDGARRVGKSYIAKEFGKNEYKSYIIIDFGIAPKNLLELFDNETANLDLFFAKLSAFFGIKILPNS